MLSLKGSYNLDEIRLMYDALEHGYLGICSAESEYHGCDGCSAHKVCRDLLSAMAYISKICRKNKRIRTPFLQQK